jgi:hypothetical protein
VGHAKRKEKKQAPALDALVAPPLVKQWYNAEEAVVPGSQKMVIPDNLAVDAQLRDHIGHNCNFPG